ncbi:hypothetical protein F4778DRAFT_780217 [Xylariomycetidae sp. FL2044]|nr:hypothetical protein F4778DRAFT_780217 [Xylariomycetidae sp. FL2044]
MSYYGSPNATASPATQTKFSHVENTLYGLTTVAILLVALRVWARSNTRRGVWADDYYLMVALFFVLSDGVLLVLLLKWAALKDPWVDSTLVTITSIMGTSNSLAQAFSKTSLAVTYMQFIEGTFKVYLWCLTIGMDILLFAQVWTYWVRMCQQQNRQPDRLPGHCTRYAPVRDFYVAVQVVSFIVDVVLTYLPWHMVWGKNLGLKRLEKFGMALAMSIGVCASIAGLYRIVLWLRTQVYAGTEDVMSDIYVWNFAEPAITVIAACVPILRTLVYRLIRKLRREDITMPPPRGPIPERYGERYAAPSDSGLLGSELIELGSISTTTVASPPPAVTR